MGGHGKKQETILPNVGHTTQAHATHASSYVCVRERESERDLQPFTSLKGKRENSHLITRIYLRVNLLVKDIDHHNVWFSSGNNVGNILGTSQQTMREIDGNTLSII
jgi:hypothetical protein